MNNSLEQSSTEVEKKLDTNEGQENQSDLIKRFNDVINKMHVVHISQELGLNKRQAYLLKKGHGAKVDINKLLDFLTNI